MRDPGVCDAGERAKQNSEQYREFMMQNYGYATKKICCKTPVCKYQAGLCRAMYLSINCAEKSVVKRIQCKTEFIFSYVLGIVMLE